jgi:histidyl-tRNA synthetase
VSFMIHLGLLKTPRKSPAQVFVLVHAADQRPLSLEVADKLRQRGIATLVSHSARAYGKQMQQAQRMGIDYVWFPAQAGQAHVVKDITKGEQFEVDIETWNPATPKV